MRPRRLRRKLAFGYEGDKFERRISRLRTAEASAIYSQR